MKKLTLILSVLLTVLLAVPAFPAYAENAADPALRLELPDVFPVGETAQIGVALTGAKGFFGGTFLLEWDPAVFEYADIIFPEDASGRVGGPQSENTATIGVMLSAPEDADRVALGVLCLKVVAPAGTESDVTVSVYMDDIDIVPVPAPLSAHVRTGDAVSYLNSGSCGEKLEWKLSEDGVLTISGEGGMADYSAEKSPWAGDGRIRSLVVKDGVTSVSAGAFENCGALSSVSLPDTLEYLGVKAFSGCTALKELDLREGLKWIGADAISGTAIKKIVIPKKVSYLPYTAFCGCATLERIEVADGNPYFRGSEDGLLIDRTNGGLVCYPAGKTDPEFTVGEDISVIEDGAFSNNPYLERITLPKQVRQLDALLFAGCENLRQIDLPDTLASIAANAFADSSIGYDCTGVIRFLPNGWEPSGCTWNRCLDGTAWEKAQPDGVLYAGRVAYGYKGADAKTVKELTLANGTIAVADGAFTALEGLRRIGIPASVKKIGKSDQNGFPVSGSVFANPAGIVIVCPENCYAAYFANNTHMQVELTPYAPLPGEDGTLVPADGEPIRVDDEKRTVYLTPGTSVSSFFGMVKNEITRLCAFDGTPEHAWIADDALMQTGGSVNTYDENDEALQSYAVVVLCDVDGDGRVKAADARTALRAAARLESLDGAYLLAATRGKSEKVTSGDARYILRVAAMLETVSF
ncbi:MAG: leucine-rich repeat domain-containing protein [Clostridia bacterium]|nr:leucine-rich repeat domain-containing protein [Clostridia bacterium]